MRLFFGLSFWLFIQRWSKNILENFKVSEPLFVDFAKLLNLNFSQTSRCKCQEKYQILLSIRLLRNSVKQTRVVVYDVTLVSPGLSFTSVSIFFNKFFKTFFWINLHLTNNLFQNVRIKFFKYFMAFDLFKIY